MERIWMVEARESKGFSKSDLAKKTKVVRSYISEIEKGNKTPSGKVALKLSRILDLNMERFFEDELDQEELELLAKE
ncbi:helix-turn-helix transcriptional regulator [Peribacillus asahii]|uniref:helix-turn-helix transcriptional regulator n=1 Tax=Peribacillus asahii TaxID=228899 RepID=UPI002079AA40|nr:helix-turn-helix transcriptional regulator [Peribacillus asahii]USK72658.1 helix-turn-helix domain-containing protein [Peribacillus asahii]USK72695.1 helix-turn-helix domain-containing protein [Peribacillus asahii]